VLVTVHGLVDSLYVKALAKKTHRGLEGAFLCGLHAGRPLLRVIAMSQPKAEG